MEPELPTAAYGLYLTMHSIGVLHAFVASGCLCALRCLRTSLVLVLAQANLERSCILLKMDENAIPQTGPHRLGDPGTRSKTQSTTEAFHRQTTTKKIAQARIPTNSRA